MDHETFEDFARRLLAAHEIRHADHEAHMTHMERQYDKLVQIQLDLARRHDDHADRLARLDMILEELKTIVRERRN